MIQAIHISHEAAMKIGGIGSVLSGMCTAETYTKQVERTIFYGPLFDDTPNPEGKESIAMQRLGGEAKILFSSVDNIANSIYDTAFRDIIHKYSVDIVYGEKTLYDEIDPKKSNVIEVLLLGIKNLKAQYENEFKYIVWEKYQFSSQPFEGDWDFEQYLRIAIPLRDLSTALLKPEKQTIYFSHEYMGIACCLAINLLKRPNEKLYFHAHEISTARAITESIQGHDVAFYHLIDKDLQSGTSLEQRYGSQKHNPRNEQLKMTSIFDGILAVGDWVKKEYLYLLPKANPAKVHICYNGIPIPDHTTQDKLNSRKKIKEYCENLYNFTPDVIMTHVTRLVVSKGLWRDISLMEELDKRLAADKLKGFCIILSTLIGNGRTSAEVMKMEADYGWPVLHREGYPDLIDYENDIYWSCQYFNAKSKAIKVVFLNQFSFNPQRIGHRLPQGTTFTDLRLSSDAEFGMSVYEPFGIAQIETIPFGGVAILTRACGSAFLLEQAFKDEKVKPFYVLDFAQDLPRASKDVDWQHISSNERVLIEKEIIRENAEQIYAILPKSDKQREKVFEICNKHKHKLSWDEVVKGMPVFGGS